MIGRTARLVIVAHLLVLLTLVLFSSRSCRKETLEPPEATFVTIESQPAPTLDNDSTPTPEPEPEPAPAPEQKPEPVPTPEPDPAPKWTAKDPSEIKVSNKRVRNTDLQKSRVKPRLSREQIQTAVQDALKDGLAQRASSSLPQSYYQMIYRVMYRAWRQPSGRASSAAERPAMVSVRIARDGTLSARTLTRSSGSSEVDKSVMKALNSVSRIDALPNEFPSDSKTVSIEFDWQNSF